jgi:uncharacterized delta-60 repeat protein
MNSHANRFGGCRTATIAAIALAGIAGLPSHATSITAGPNTVGNGGFETPAVVHASTLDVLPRGSNALAPWAIGGLSIELIKGYWQAAEGFQSIDLGAGSISQVLPTEPGRNYLLSFKYSKNPDQRRGTPKMTVRWGPGASGPFSLKEQFTYTGTVTKANMNWQRVERTVRATSTSTYVSFASSLGDDVADHLGNGIHRGGGREIIGLGVALDDVSVTLVPDIAAPKLLQAVATGGTNVFLIGRIDGAPGVTITLQASTAKTCAAGTLAAGTAAGAPIAVTTDGAGYFGASFSGVNPGDFVAVQVASPAATPLSTCLVSSRDNDSWPKAFPLVGSPVAAQDFIDAPGKARWYRFSVIPGQRIQVALTGLPADYNLVVFKDIGQAFLSQFNPAIANTNSLLKMTAEYAPSVWSPSVWSPSVWSPDAYSPSVWSPSVWSPSVWSPSVWSPSAFDPSHWPPPPLNPSLFPEVLQAFSVAQTRSVIGVTVTPGTGDKSLVVNTWNNTGNFYVRITGRGDAFDTGTPFTVGITKGLTTCTGVTDTTLTPRSPMAASGIKTVILTDSSQLALDDTLPIPGGGTLRSKLALFAARTDVMGVVVDVAGDARVSALKQQAAANPACPFAKNLVAQEIKGIVDTYATNPLLYVVIVGNDAAIPFFRSPDTSGLGDESNYVPPVQSNSTSDASLRLDFVLSQDGYGSKTTIALPSSDFPVPGLAVGRLVETPVEIAGIIDAYVSIDGVVVPGSSLVTGYDFLAQAANAVTTELQAGIGAGGVADSLVTPDGVSPQDPASWTSSQLAAKLFGSRHDIIFLAGHFSANSALAADFSTSLITTDLAASQTNFTNSIVFSAGCHSGYNLVDADAIPGVTLPLDWAQAFARKKATLIAGTGYQYGDTDFIKFSEQIYLNLARQFRAGTGAIPVGAALVAAKLDYLVATPDIRGIPEKALLEATLYGLPMLAVNMPSGRGASSGSGGVITPVLVASGPAHDLGLMTYDLGLSPSLTSHSVTLKNLGGGPDVAASYLSGPDGVATNPGDPVLPLAMVNVTPTDSNLVLRGIGLRAGIFNDSAPMFPFTAAPTTELRGAHVPFLSQVFYPARMWSPNYFGALAGSGGTELLVTPTQHRAANFVDGSSTRRSFSSLNVRLYYSGNLSQAALSEAPTIVGLDAQPDAGGVLFAVQVVGDPAASIAQVWITYTSDGANVWASLDLTQCVSSVPNGPLPATCGATNDSRLWTGRLAVAPTNLKYLVQAVNGVGLVTLDDNLGSFHGLEVAPPTKSTIAFISAPATATIGDSVAFTVQLTLTGSVAGRTVSVTAGGVSRLGTTAGDGTATVTIPVGNVIGTLPVTVSYAGDDAFEPSSVTTSIVVSKAASTLTRLLPAGAVLTGVLGGTTAALQQEAISFSVTGPGGPATISVITDYLGQAMLPPPGLPAGDYTATQASFGGNATYAAANLIIAPAQSFTVAKTAQGVTFDALAGKTFGDADFALYATASSGLPVSYTATGACTVVGNTVHITGPGSCTITASQGGDANYGVATSVAQTFAIGSAPTVVSLVRAGPNPTMAGTVTYTLTFSEAVTGVASRNFAIVPSGIAAASVGTISGAGTTWTVTVNTGRGTGTLHLDVVNGAGITNTASVTLAGTPFTGETYQIDKGGTVLGTGEGRPVAGFGNAGYALFSDVQSVGVYSAPVAASHLSVLADGRILAAGGVGCVADVPSDPNSLIYCTLQLARYSASGVLDTSFGTNGRVLTAVTNIYPELSALIVNSDGTFFVNGIRNNGTAGVAFAAKFADSGAPVSAFGTNGLASLDSMPLGWAISGSAIDGAGRIVIAGTKATGTSEGDDIFVARLTSLGAIDTTFGTSGVAQFAISTVDARNDRGTAVAVQPDGRIVVGGRTHVTTGLGFDFLLLRLDTNGALDPSFGSNGIATTRFTGSTLNNLGRKLVLQPGGRIVLVGYVAVDATTFRCGIARFNANGTLDATFGTGGQVQEPVGIGCFDVSEQADGKLVLVANDQVADVSYGTILRLLPTGAADPGFGTGGFQDISSFDGPGRVAFTAGGNLVTSLVVQDPADGVLKSYVVELSTTLAGPSLPQTITFNAIGDVSYGQPAFALTATASSGLPVSYTASGACAVAGNMVQVGAVGSCTITASQAGVSSYLPAAPVARTFAINPATQAITFGPAPVGVTVGLGLVYVNATSTSPTAAPSAMPIALTSLTPSVCTVGGSNAALVVALAAGVCTIAANQAGDGNYTAAPQATLSFDIGPAGTGPSAFTVTNLLDSGAGSLRDAIAQANAAASGPNIIDLTGLAGTIVLTSGQIQISRSLFIEGPGAANLTIDGNANSRIFSIFATDPACPALDGPDYLVLISNIRLTNALRPVDGSGGAIFTEHSLSLDSVIVDNSMATRGGGVSFIAQYPGQVLVITNSQFLNNFAEEPAPPTSSNNAAGAGLNVQDRCLGPVETITDLPYVTPVTVTIANTEFVGNRAGSTTLDVRGGAIRSYSLADITISDTRIVGNHVLAPIPPVAGKVYQGGGIWAEAKSLLIYQSEIADNTASDATGTDATRSGGLHLVKDAVDRQGPGDAMAVRIVNSTVSGNSSAANAGAMLAFGNVALELDNTTVNGNSAAPTRNGGIQMSTGTTYPVSAGNAAAPTLKVVSSILANNSVRDVGTNTTAIPAFGINAFNSLIQNVCSGCATSISGPGNLIGVDPLVGPLNFNGGTTRTHALLPGSPAINTGSNPFGLTTDQRGTGFPRMSGAGPDMGAFESP